MTQATSSLLLPDGFRPPRAAALVRERRVGGVLARAAVREGWRSVRSRSVEPWGQPVVLVPGFLAGDRSLVLMGRALRRAGFDVHTSGIRANVGCASEVSAALEARLEAIVAETGTRVQLVGHSLGGMLARALAVRRPDLVAGIVTLGSPVLAPGAHHLVLSTAVTALTRLGAIGVRGVMLADCVAGECARTSFAECSAPLPRSVVSTAVWSRRDGIVDWRACVDPAAESVEVRACHLAMACDPAVVDLVVDTLLARLPQADEQAA